MAARDRGLNERIVFLTDKNQREWLQKQSESTGAPVGDIIRRAITTYQAWVKKQGK